MTGKIAASIYVRCRGSMSAIGQPHPEGWSGMSDRFGGRTSLFRGEGGNFRIVQSCRRRAASRGWRAAIRATLTALFWSGHFGTVVIVTVEREGAVWQGRKMASVG